MAELQDHNTPVEESPPAEAPTPVAAEAAPVEAPAVEAPPAEAPAASSIDPHNLVNDPDWLNASATLWLKQHPGQQWEGSKEDMVKFGLDTMGWFNYNTPTMAYDAAKLAGADPEEKKSFLYLLETYDKLGISWGGVGRFAKGAALDPLTYVGISSLGIGTAVGQGAKVATKEGLKAALKGAIRQGALTGIETGIIGAGQDALRQSAEINAGGKDAYDAVETLKAAGLGFVLGGALGGAVEGVAGLTRGAGKAAARDVAKDANPSAAIERDTGALAPEAPPTAPEGTTPLHTSPEGSKVPSTDGGVPPAVQGSVEAPLAAKADIPTGADNPILKAVREIAENSGLREYPRTAEELSTASHSAVDEVLKLTPEQAKPLIEEVRRAASTGEQSLILKDALATATDTLLKQNEQLARDLKAATDPAAKATLQAQLDTVHQLLDVVRPLDTDTSSLTGRELGARVGKTNTNDFREITPDNLMRKQGIDPHLATDAQREAAHAQFDELLLARFEAAKNDKAIVDLNFKIEDAANAGMFDEVAKLQADKARLMGQIVTAPGDLPSTVNKVMAYATEFVIGNVFTPKTLVMNTIPSLLKVIYKPALDALARGPLDSVSWRMAASAYTAMATSIPAALRAGVAAFKYERGLLSGDFSKLLEHEPMFTKKYGIGPITPGSVVRFFPRVLQATDEVFSQIFYRSHVVSEATGNAYQLGLSKGLKGDALDTFVKTKVDAAVERSFADKIDHGAVDMLYNEGVARGLKGDKLDHFVKTELQANSDLLTKATDEGGKRYADDALFKRRFDESEYGGAALAYENFSNRNPLMKLAGQLFFRTPVRVFEEGLRLTPGLNLVTPGFVKDLRGINGPAAQVRAHGEAMLSLGFGMSTMLMFANGAITGAGPSDAKQNKQWRQAGNDPYTMKIGDYKLNFRNLDPISTPIKIIVNTLEKISELHYREAQGEYVRKSEYDQAAAYVAAGMYGLTKALKDSNLLEGISQIIDATDMATDPEGKEAAMWRFIGQKITMFTPNTLTKINAIKDPTQNDPFDLAQIVRNRFDPSSALVPRRYDSLGNVSVDDNPIAGLTGVDISKAKTEKTPLDDLKGKLANLAIAANTDYIAPYKHELVPGVDLRSQPTADGKSTLYDSWQKHVREDRYGGQTMAEALTRFFKQAEAAKLSPEAMNIGVKSVIKGYRDAAMGKVVAEDRNGFEAKVAGKKFQIESKAGLHEPTFMPFKSN